jgi:hypothetical protein
MTAFRYFVGRRRGWLSCALLGMLLSLGVRLAAQPVLPGAERPGILLGAPTLQAPVVEQVVRPVAAQGSGKEKSPVMPAYPAGRSLGVPSTRVLFRLESEEDLRQRIRDEQRGPLTFPLVAGVPVVSPAAKAITGKEIVFPDSRIVLSKTPFMMRQWPPEAKVVEPYYTVYRRLYFEQINAERYGWDFGYMHPLIATTTFYIDLATLPFQFIAEPCRRYEYNSGYCLPGDSVPLFLYPPHPK